jgi:DNA helicase HerA-like ATPase/energy-coupling factor transporter ATP-binding protein EcfA2
MSSVLVGEKMTAIALSIARRLDDEITRFVLGDGLTAFSKKVSPTGEKITVEALVHLALLNDALVIAEQAVLQDGVITAEEKAFVTPLAQTAVRYLVHFRRTYEEFEAGIEDAKDFLDAHINDSQLFGGKCADTRWAGAQICRNFAINASDDGPLIDYRDTMVRLVDDIFDLTKGSDPAGQRQLRAEIERHSHLERTDTADGRAAAFCAPSAGAVFHAVAHAGEVFERDAMDVEAIHAEARDVFAHTLQRVAAVNRPSKHGAMLLIKGESGAGKTHLMRAFRNYVHEKRVGYVGYLQMTSAGGSYARHVLTNLVDSLELPFLAGEPSSLACIADSLMRWRVSPELASALREEADPKERASIVGRIVDHLVAQPVFDHLDVDLVRAFVYLASNDAVLGSRVKRYLRCDQLSDYDRQHLGGITPPSDENAPLRMLAGIGRLISASHGGALVLLVDQLEDVYEVTTAQQRFRHLMDVLRQLSELVPTSLSVVASLDDFYEKLRDGLTRPLLDRLEHDPKPVHIVAPRTREEIELLVEMRLRALYDQQSARIRDDEPLFPFDSASIHALAGLRTRDVLEWCRNAQERCAAAGRIVSSSAPAVAAPHVTAAAPAASATKGLAAEWAEHLGASSAPSPDEESLLQLLGWAARQAGREANLEVAVSTSEGLEVSLGEKRTTVAICNAPPQGGHLARQVDALSQKAAKKGHRVALVRCQDFPTTMGKTTVTAKAIGEIIKKGGAKLVARDSDWRTLSALRAFIEKRASSPELEKWMREERIAARLELMRGVVGDELVPRTKPVSAPPPAASPAPPPVSAVAPPPTSRGGTKPGELFLGRTRSLSPMDVTRDPAALMRHAAFLGSTGSGKTTLALNLIEQCLLQGTPVLLVDRKGDLCRYASPAFWSEVDNDPARAERKRLLRERIHVQVFTPGEHRGRPLALPVVPPGLADVDVAERNSMTTAAAAGLGSMMNYRGSQQDSTRQTILAKAIEVLALGGKKEVGLKDIVDLIDAQDPALVDAIGKLDTRHFKALVDHVETLRLRFETLLKGGEMLTAELLFGLGEFAKPGKTALSIVSTKFLPDSGVIDFWVSRLLIELTRWSSRHPSPKLQAIVMLDEADIYLPAQTKPATKQPVQDLLKRARSAGVGVFLATQSPGDLDYRCRDNITSWFVGKISEKTALDKMKPLLSAYKANPSAKLAAAKTGDFFLLAETNVTELKAERSLMNTEQLAEEEIISAARAGLA